jgi:hypothetical protein
MKSREIRRREAWKIIAGATETVAVLLLLLAAVEASMEGQTVAAFLQAAILLVTAIIVWRYTRETHQLRETAQQQLKHTRDQSETMQRPSLFLFDKTTGDHRSLYAENLGYGPAMNIVRVIIQPGGLMGSAPFNRAHTASAIAGC